MEYESVILKRLIDTYGVVGNPRYISEIIKEFIVQGKERFPNLFTYQADWLAHIDEFGLNPSYTVSYTGQSIYAPNTLEKPVKSAILKGQTLVNLVSRVDKSYFGSIGTITPTFNTSSNFISTIMTYPANNTDKKGAVCFKITRFLQYAYNTDLMGLKGKTFTLLATIENGTNSNINIILSENGYNTTNGYTITTISSKTSQNIKTTFTVGDTNLILGHNTILASSPEYCSMSNIVIVEGEFTNQDIPYFEGMQSVKMPVLKATGKNLFYSTLEYGDFNNSTGIPNNTSSSIIRTKEYNEISSNGTYRITVFNETATSTAFYVHEYDNDFNYIKSTNSNIFTTSANTKYVKFRFRKSNSATYTEEELSALSCMITKENTIPTTYEPYKSNILTVNEDVELGSVGEVKDELDLLTGKITQRTDIRPYQESDESDSEVLTDMTNTRYKLAQEVVKTVDLSILDQNGQNVKQLMSFNGGTHFNTTSLEGSPLPTVSVSVETDLEETLRVCSLEGNTM